MIFTETKLKGSYTVDLDIKGDNRGWFTRFYCNDEFSQINHTSKWVQMNHTFTKQKGTIRGMHFQKPPHSEIKLVRCISGSVYDVIIDLRADSPTYLKWVSFILSKSNKRMIYIPKGFAHGFQALSNNCELIYLHSESHNKEYEDGIKYDDPSVGVEWKLPLTQISYRDSQHPYLRLKK